jgi:hypothetical protein
VQVLSAGQYIKHFQYGCGVITESDSSRTTIDFDIHGVKKFVTGLMAVELAEGVPPKRRHAKRSKPAKTVTTPASSVLAPGVK